MSLSIKRIWPLFLITIFLFVPKFTFAAAWTNIGFADKNIKTVFVDPKNNQRILISLASYIDNNYNFITANGGTSWTPINMNGTMTQCNNFVNNPKTSNEIWAGCAVGLYRSIDGGMTFTAISNFRTFQAVNVNVSVDGTVYLTTTGNGLYKSTDGVIWETLKPPTSNNPPVIFLNKYASNEIYLSLAGTGTIGLYKSTDWGVTWTLLNNQVPINRGINQLIFQSTGRMCASAGTVGIGCSTDGGYTWGTFASPNLEKPVEWQHFYRLEQNPDDENNLLVLSGTWGGLDTKIYNYKSGSVLPEVLPTSDYTGAITISQGVTYSWSPNTNWIKGVWRNDGIAVMPEYLKKHPVIIVPGLLGSAFVPASGKWELDPILHTYDGLYASLVDSGLIPEKDIFIFPYQWRNSNKYTATLLANKITEIKQKTGANKVDIIAHSMGGIVTRIYAQGNTYANDINNIFFLGTPQLGASNAFPIWEAGYTGYEDAFFGALLSFVLKEESITNGYFDNGGMVDYIKTEVSSIGQLLPTYPYVNFGGDVGRGPENYLLNELNENREVLKARGINVTNIVGDTGPKTISGFTLKNSSDYPFWQFGEPIGLSLGDKYTGVNFTYGDGTVTVNSQSYIDGKNIILSDVEHNQLPDYSSTEIEKILGLSTSIKITTRINEILMIKAYSPVDFYVLAPDGKRIGFNKSGGSFNEIGGAFYTGNESETEFITIPNPLPGVYKVITYGTDTGEYEIEATYTDDDKNISFSSSYVGQAEPDKEDNLVVMFSPETHSIKTSVEDKTAPSVVININKLIFTHWDKLILTCDASDDESGVEEFIVKIDGNIINCEESINLFEQELGSHNIEYMAKDNAGNLTSGEKQYIVEANHDSLARDIVWLYENKHFKNRGDAISLLAQVEISRFFDLLGKQQKSLDALARALQFTDKLKEKSKIDTYGCDMITNDIKYILEDE